jgi:hypothetical protein
MFLIIKMQENQSSIVIDNESCPKKNVLHINTITLGIGGIVVSNIVFKNLLKQKIFSDIYVYPVRTGVDLFRDTFPKDYFDKFYDIMDCVFEDKHIHVCRSSPSSDDSQMLTMCTYELAKQYNIQIKLEPYYLYHISDKTPLIQKPYITINMKILTYKNQEFFNEISYRMCNLLNKYCFIPTVLLGERKITKCYEYTVCHNVYSMYEYLSTNLKNTIDYTIEESSNMNDVDDVKKMFNIVRHSELNIYCSGSGIGVIFPCLSYKVIGLIDGWNNDIGLVEGSDNVELYMDYLLFFECLENRLKRIEHSIRDSS